MIDSVVGVTIWTKNLDQLTLFYKDTLGLTVHSVHEDFVTFRFGEMRLNLGLHSQVEGTNKDPYRIMVHLGTSDIHALYEQLSGQAVNFIRPPERESWGGWVGTFLDPDGNILQILQQP